MQLSKIACELILKPFLNYCNIDVNRSTCRVDHKLKLKWLFSEVDTNNIILKAQ